MGPSKIKPSGDRRGAQPEQSCPLRDCSCGTVQHKVSIATRVIGLFNPRGPIAVVLGVTTIVVAALQGVFVGRSAPHVFNETIKAGSPAFANRDATQSVTRVGTNMATLAHRAPNAPLRGIAHAVRAVRHAGDLRLKTAATLGVCAAQLIGIHSDLVAALALAEPASGGPSLVSPPAFSRRFLGRTFNHGQPSVNIPGQIHQFRHNPYICLG